MKKWMMLSIITAVLIALPCAIAYSLLKDSNMEAIAEPEVYFCPADDCASKLAEAIMESESHVDCAFYDLRHEKVIEALESRDSRLVLDDEAKYQGRKDDGSGLMHNKFCVIDDKVVATGSFNPTHNDNDRNNNNLIIIRSRLLADNYNKEFNELWEGRFRGGAKVRKEKVYLDGNMYENYFCPEDECEKHVIESLEKARESVYFMAFSFTSKPILDFLISNNGNLDIRGVIEKTQNSEWCVFDAMNESGMNVRLDKNPKNMHHKVFIIDRSIVILGSYNPTKSGNERNDENILIIHDKEIADRFVEEFERVW